MDTIIADYKGIQIIDASAIYCPYIPLQMASYYFPKPLIEQCERSGWWKMTYRIVDESEISIIMDCASQIATRAVYFEDAYGKVYYGADTSYFSSVITVFFEYYEDVTMMVLSMP